MTISKMFALACEFCAFTLSDNLVQSEQSRPNLVFSLCSLNFLELFSWHLFTWCSPILLSSTISCCHGNYLLNTINNVIRTSTDQVAIIWNIYSHSVPCRDGTTEPNQNRVAVDNIVLIIINTDYYKALFFNQSQTGVTARKHCLSQKPHFFSFFFFS